MVAWGCRVGRTEVSDAGKQMMVGDTDGGYSVGLRLCVCGESCRLMLRFSEQQGAAAMCPGIPETG